MGVYVADHAWSWIDSLSLKAAGYVGDIGYCSLDPTKNWTADQIKDRLGAGLDCGIVWETTGMRSLSGTQGAQADAPEFLRQAQSLGATGGFLSVNLEDPSPVDPSNYPVMCDYAREMRRQIRAAGYAGMVGYGSDRAMSYMAGNGGSDRKWVVESWPFGTGNPDLLQYANSHPLNTWNGDIDCNLAASADWPHALFFGAQGGLEVLDPNDPIVIELRNGLAEVRTSVGSIRQDMETTDETDLSGNKTGSHWVWNDTYELVKQLAAAHGASSGGSIDPHGLAVAVADELHSRLGGGAQV